MYPGCRFVDLHPRPREKDPMFYATHHGPGYMKLDTASSPVNYESFPYNYETYGCPPYPLPYHACYHNHIPDYHGYALHYPHYGPPPPVYYHGSYPPLPGSYHFQYLPSPHYSAVDPRYKYDNKAPVDHHCCGCPNYLCQQKENKNVKIEGQTPDNGNDKLASVVPSELKHQSHPVLWIPPSYKRNEECEQTIKPEYMRESSLGKEAEGSLKPSAPEPGVWNGWLPINLNNLNSLVHGRDDKGTEHQQNEGGKSFFPVGCMPCNPERKVKLDLKDGDQKSISGPSQHKMFPLKFNENEGKENMPEGDTENCDNFSLDEGQNMGDKNVVKKIIPVKQMDESAEKGLSEDDQSTENSPSKVQNNHSEMPSKHTKNKGEKKHLENNGNVHSSLSKASKLPPVCLRVDPLPSRRTRSGSSRSLSPPAQKKRSEMLSLDESSSSSSTMQRNSQQDLHFLADSDPGRPQSEEKVETVEVADSTMRDNKLESHKEDLSVSPVSASVVDLQENVSTGCQDGKDGKSDQEFSVGDEGMKNVNKLSGDVAKDEKLTIEGQSGDVKCEKGKNGGPINIKKLELTSTNGIPPHKFSEAEAATIIQSAYRGFRIRRWEPLKKLKDVARIKRELFNVRLVVQDLVSSGSENIDKQRMVIGETIMNLLLQLDTMQGLHPSIRNIRKSVAKELVSLQEKLDSITFQNSDELKESVQFKHTEDISKRACEEEREQAGYDRREHDTTSPSHISSGVMELCQDQPHTVMDLNISSVNMETSEFFPGKDEGGGASEEKESDSSSYVDFNESNPELLIKLKEPSKVDGVCEDHDSFMVESLPHSIIAEEELNPVQLQNLSSVVDSDWSSKDDAVTNVNTELPPRVPEQNSDNQISGEGLQIDDGRYIVKPGKLELVLEEQDQKGLLTESSNLSNPEDNIETTICSEGTSDPKGNIGAEGTEREKELSGDDMLGEEFVEASKEKHISNIEVEANVCIVEEDDKSTDDMRTTAIQVKEISNMEKPANACEVAREGDNKPVDDMQTEDNVEAEAKETPHIEEAVNVCEIEGDENPVDDMQTTSSVLRPEKRETPEVEFKQDVGLVEAIESIETCMPKLEDLSMETSELWVKQQKPSFFNLEQKMTMDEDEEMREDKFDDKEIYKKHSNGNMVDLPGDEDLVEEEFGSEKVDKTSHREFATGEGDKTGEDHVAKQPQEKVLASSPILGEISSATETESDKKLKETVDKLIVAGKQQLAAISSLSTRVRDLEKKLIRKKKLKVTRHKSSSQ